MYQANYTFTPEQIEKAHRRRTLRTQHPPHKMPPEVKLEIETIETELHSAIGEEQTSQLFDYASLPDDIARHFEAVPYSATNRQKFLDDYAEIAAEGEITAFPTEVLNRELDRYARSYHLQKSLGDDLFAFYKWLLDTGEVSIGQISTFSPVKGQSTAYKYLNMLEERELVKPIPRKWRAVELVVPQ